MQATINTHQRSPSRRKACGECFKSKRRCDLRLSKCSRCTRQKLDCQYLLPPPQRERHACVSGSGLNDTHSITATSEPFENNAAPLPLLDETMLVQDLDLNFLNDWDVPSCSTQLDFQTEPEIEHLLLPQFAAQDDRVPQELKDTISLQLNYTIKILKNTPSRMVLENGTPWSHPLLYKDFMPKSMHDAHAACALYIAKNETNQHLIFRAIDERAKELLNAPNNVTPVENLARVQSLLLYQIIRLYDGDIRLRAQGEAAMEDLELYAHALLGLLEAHNMSINLLPSITHLSSTTTKLNTSSPPSHPTWIFQESCRRTFLFSFFFFAIYKMLKERGCSRGHFAAQRAWTISAPLWDAPSEFDFRVAWREKRRFIIQDIDFEEVLREAVPGEVDEFGRMFLVATRGLDEMREWFYERGEKLVC